MRRSLRTRSMIKVKKRVQGNRTAVHFRRRNPSSAKCGGCGKPLNGVPRLRVTKLKKLSKTKKRPERPYGGHLCTGCSRGVFRERVFGLE